METIRQKMIIFRYQLLHIKSGKAQITKTLQIVRPDLKQYEDIVRKLKSKIRERRTLLDAKKAIPAIQMFRHRELAQKIAALTEDIEELKSEKVLLLNQFDCVGDHGMTEVKQRVASMEASLGKLDQQEIKYTAELDSTWVEYTELQQQTEDIDATELDTARQVIRPGKEHGTVQRLQNAYGKRFDSGILVQSRKDVAEMLGEGVEPVSIREGLQQTVEQQNNRRYTKNTRQER